MEALLICLSSKECCNLFNGDLSTLVRKKFPKDYVGWVYIYVTKALPHLVHTIDCDYDVYDETQWEDDFLDLNGKVVARFWCDKVERIEDCLVGDIRKNACLTEEELFGYLFNKSGYAIHITKLEIFDKPKEISEFEHQVVYENIYTNEKRYLREPLRKVPKTYCNIEI